MFLSSADTIPGPDGYPLPMDSLGLVTGSVVQSRAGYFLRKRVN